MGKVRDTPMILIGVLGLIGVVAAAAGSHWLDPNLSDKLKLAWDHAVQFNLIHTAAMMAIFAALKIAEPESSAARWLNRSFVLLFAGTTIFCGTVYAICLGVPGKQVGHFAPVGGITMMLGWVSVAIAGF
ncbi:hypothetical protein, conserved [Trypanosoma brucei gambiense DAL972]|uniref:DUF423 domain-containing protein n=3 Tax=Trypanosoma brucei TaxID=5691 RepID=Q384Q6_TRYB2|nr:hypothetical protein, conserved [Trypanosoma brucei gambiense DAL972]XP_828837.1 hypothetical protein, conserved [Trypanosoma brucei brucei TREU927]RHW67167.1 hypothetical protein DPX39_000027400 [Trypanosoma brucei equiperdum]EAN79725.1 hypothetical protein, conserved [Trypanosoma brucei brucei TREU927]RHW67257.1 hypothetical protein DPX39_000027300 [Trypanosoma brucei equiperdum]CBH17749.1 hypothetical protein, conserved [Trypanosoma brucei gambiense DAL972]|eukprot:XP_011780013.1 hypothetical protein, conserved [Trypanosoma brucei gambiense DAL972]